MWNLFFFKIFCKILLLLWIFLIEILFEILLCSVFLIFIVILSHKIISFFLFISLNIFVSLLFVNPKTFNQTSILLSLSIPFLSFFFILLPIHCLFFLYLLFNVVFWSKHSSNAFNLNLFYRQNLLPLLLNILRFVKKR